MIDVFLCLVQKERNKEKDEEKKSKEMSGGEKSKEKGNNGGEKNKKKSEGGGGGGGDGGEKKNKKKEDGPITVVLKVDMHCDGCAMKVKKSVRGYEGDRSIAYNCNFDSSLSLSLSLLGSLFTVSVVES